MARSTAHFACMGWDDLFPALSNDNNQNDSSVDDDKVVVFSRS